MIKESPIAHKVRAVTFATVAWTTWARTPMYKLENTPLISAICRSYILNIWRAWFPKSNKLDNAKNCEKAKTDVRYYLIWLNIHEASILTLFFIYIICQSHFASSNLILDRSQKHCIKTNSTELRFFSTYCKTNWQVAANACKIKINFQAL